MKIFKNKAEKLIELNQEVENLNKKYFHLLNSIHIEGTSPFIFKKFTIFKNEICTDCQYFDTPNNMICHVPYWTFSYNIENTRRNWLILKDKLEKLGINLTLQISEKPNN